MTVVKSTGSRFLCYEPLIEMITVQNPMVYHNLEQVYEPSLEPGSIGYWRVLCQQIVIELNTQSLDTWLTTLHTCSKIGHESEVFL